MTEIVVSGKEGEVAHLTFHPQPGDQHPAIAPIPVGSFFEDCDGGRWRITEFTMVEEKDPMRDHYEPPREHRYHWRHTVARVKK